MDRYTQLFVVSDLHIGGVAERAIFQDAPALGALIRHVATVKADGPVGLVLAGDVFDLLAEEGAAPFEAKSAARRVRAILERPVFRPVFDAMARLVATPDRRLVVVPGNHDVELYLSEVHAAIRERLGAVGGEAATRLVFAAEGKGYTALVGGQKTGWKRVNCIHGEVADVTNVIDLSKIQAVDAALRAGVEAPAFPEPVGTHMVLDVINPVKQRFPIIDLLKPEFGGAVPLAALLVHSEPDGATRWRRLVTEALKNSPALMRDKMKRGFGYLSDEDEGPVEGQTDRRGYDPRAAGEEVVLRWLGATEDPRDLAADDEVLGLYNLLVLGRWKAPDLAWLREKWLAIREKMKAGKDVDVWCEDAEDATLDWVERNTQDEVHVVIAGHTHLRRAKVGRGPWTGHYFNSGTWIQLMRLPDAIVDLGKFQAWFERVRSSRTVRDLMASQGEPLVFTQRSVVRVVAEPDRVRAGISEVVAQGAVALGDGLFLADVEGTWALV
jgi:3',5'-cyclic AMP phosphodiesterase CpdA